VSVTELVAEVPDYVAPVEAWRVGASSTSRRDQLGKRGAGDDLAGRRRPGGVLPPRQRMSPRIRRRCEHGAPQAGCQCGIYAGEPSVLRQYLAEPLGSAAVARVSGRVALWGVVVECERGFRASHAYPVEVYVPADAIRGGDYGWDELSAGLRRYGISVLLLPSRSRDAPQVLARAGH
jgi:hypothetical protein